MQNAGTSSSVSSSRQQQQGDDAVHLILIGRVAGSSVALVWLIQLPDTGTRRWETRHYTDYTLGTWHTVTPPRVFALYEVGSRIENRD